MQKTAQKRSLLNKLKEMTDVGGIATEKYFNPEFKEIMDQLRNVDDGARAIAAGEQVGEASAPADAISLKDLLKSVKSNINRREYMKSVADLGRFHRKMFDITHLISLFNSNVDKIHERFLFQDLDEDSKKHLQYFKSKWSSANIHQPYFIKEANILDFFTNIATERGRALSSWEKRYPNRIKKLKTDVTTILEASEKNLNILLSVLKDMAKARASRNPDSYIASASKITSNFKNYDDMFKKFYDEHVKGFLEKQEFFAPTKTDTSEKTEDLSKKDIQVETKNTTNNNVPLINPTNIIKPIIPSLPPIPQFPGRSTSVSETAKNLTVNPNDFSKTIEEGAPQFEEDKFDETATIPNSKVAPAHQKFMNSLVSISEESPILLSAHINRYAKAILPRDPETAIKLFKLVKSIKD